MARLDRVVDLPKIFPNCESQSGVKMFQRPKPVTL